MKYQFKQAVCFLIGDEKKEFRYALGVSEVPKEVEEHWYFLKLVEAGLVHEPDLVKEASKPLSAHERSKMLYDKLTAKKESPKAVPAPVKEKPPEKKSKG